MDSKVCSPRSEELDGSLAFLLLLIIIRQRNLLDTSVAQGQFHERTYCIDYSFLLSAYLVRG